jgi:hypothetical protein
MQTRKAEGLDAKRRGIVWTPSVLFLTSCIASGHVEARVPHIAPALFRSSGRQGSSQAALRFLARTDCKWYRPQTQRR